MVKHIPLFEKDEVAKHYGGAGEYKVEYVCTTALDCASWAMDVFFCKTPHPVHGNQYFGLHIFQGEVYIRDADLIETLMFSMIEDDEGDLHYSQHRHNMVKVGDKMIDGGRAYVRSNCATKQFRVVQGKFEAVEK